MSDEIVTEKQIDEYLDSIHSAQWDDRDMARDTLYYKSHALEQKAENAELRKRIEKLVEAGNELDGLLVTIMQQEYVTGTLPFTDHGRSFASSAHDKWQSILESSDD